MPVSSSITGRFLTKISRNTPSFGPEWSGYEKSISIIIKGLCSCMETGEAGFSNWEVYGSIYNDKNTLHNVKVLLFLKEKCERKM